MVNRFDNRVFVIDKAVGPTSFDVVAAMRRVSGLRKVGHAGTLDPLARGVLLLCTGTATRAVEHFMDLEKEYEFDIRLGVETTTLDAEGDVVREAPVPPVSIEQLRDVAESFVGDYTLTPPAFSAIKRRGRRHYELARSGEPAEAAPRTVAIRALDIVGVDLPVVRCVVRCSRGTYVRSLARDFGERIGVPASLSALTRSRIGSFTVADAFPSDKLVPGAEEAPEGIALGDALSFLPGAVITSRARAALQFGTLPLRQEVVRTIGATRGGVIRILDEQETLLAIGTRNPERPRDPLRVCDSLRMFVDVGSTPASGVPRGDR